MHLSKIKLNAAWLINPPASRPRCSRFQGPACSGLSPALLARSFWAAHLQTQGCLSGGYVQWVYCVPVQSLSAAGWEAVKT